MMVEDVRDVDTGLPVAAQNRSRIMTNAINHQDGSPLVSPIIAQFPQTYPSVVREERRLALIAHARWESEGGALCRLSQPTAGGAASRD